MAVLVPELCNFASDHDAAASTPGRGAVARVGEQDRRTVPVAASEHWPSCAECDVDLTPVLQLRRRDVPDVAFPAGTDLLQLFWCPDEAAHGYQPAPRIRWRAAAAVTSPRADDPDLSGFPRTSDWEGYVPFECTVYPERVIEYPLGDDLYDLAGEERAAQIRRLVENMDVGPADDLTERFTGEHGLSSAEVLRSMSLVSVPVARWEGSRGSGRRAGSSTTWLHCPPGVRLRQFPPLARGRGSATFRPARRAADLAPAVPRIGVQALSGSLGHATRPDTAVRMCMFAVSESRGRWLPTSTIEAIAEPSAAADRGRHEALAL